MKTLLLIGILGCIMLFTACYPEAGISDPNAIIDPNTTITKIIEDTAEGAVGLTQLLSTLWPALIPVGTAGAGILAAYKRLKPKIQAAQDERNKYHAGGATLAIVLEDIKLNEPEMWEKIGPKIAKATDRNEDIFDAIKGFRGV